MLYVLCVCAGTHTHTYMCLGEKLMKVSFSIAMFFKAPIGELGPSHLGHTGQQVPMLACLSSNSSLTGIHLVLCGFWGPKLGFSCLSSKAFSLVSELLLDGLSDAEGLISNVYKSHLKNATVLQGWGWASPSRPFDIHWSPCLSSSDLNDWLLAVASKPKSHGHITRLSS